MKRLLLLAGTLLCSASAVCAAAPASAPDYAITASIPGPAAGGWDYARVDAAAHRLYIARSNSVTVIDTATGKALPSIGAIQHGHAVVPIPHDRLMVTSGDDDTVRILNAVSGQELAKIAVGKKPDAAIVSPDGRKAFIMNAHSGSVTILDLEKLAEVRTIAVKPGLEYAALTPQGLFINNEDDSDMEFIDLVHGARVTALALPGCDAPSGLAFDARTSRLIAACDNGKAAIVDSRTQRLIDLVGIGKGPDAVILDAARRLAFIPCGKDGELDILTLDGAKVHHVKTVKTQFGARTGALDARTGAIYLPTAQPAALNKSGTRMAPVPGTFHVLVLKPV